MDFVQYLHRNVNDKQSDVTFLDQSSNSSCVLSFSLKLSPSAFSFCPSTWLSHPLPSTASTRRIYASSCRSICLAHIIDPDNGGKSRTRLMWHELLLGYCTCKEKAYQRWETDTAPITKSVTWIQPDLYYSIYGLNSLTADQAILNLRCSWVTERQAKLLNQYVTSDCPALSKLSVPDNPRAVVNSSQQAITGDVFVFSVLCLWQCWDICYYSNSMRKLLQLSLQTFITQKQWYWDHATNLQVAAPCNERGARFVVYSNTCYQLSCFDVLYMHVTLHSINWAKICWYQLVVLMATEPCHK